ncbi:MAG: rhodanese-like domain-containing protein [Sideroxydans sp.]|nr:rhodanese-like domain-containing protein [Sideroxydans sp.]
MINTKTLWIAAALVLAIAVIAPQLMGQASAAEVSVQQAQSMSQQGALLLDVREADEYAALHAPRAKLIPLGEVSARLKEIEAYKTKDIVVVCRSGRRSAKAVGILKDAGFIHVSNVQGGMIAWDQAGLETIK